LAVGFETTIPAVVAVVRREPREDLLLYTAFKTVPRALEALLASPDNRIDGFLLPGHVSVIIGADAYRLLERPNGVPGVIAGFEPVDMLHGIMALLEQIVEGRRSVTNAYARAVTSEGNVKAQSLMSRMLEPSDEPWRGLGVIPGAALRLREQWRHRDARRFFSLPAVVDSEPKGCLCGRVVQGKSIPTDCRFFAKECTPDTPIGPCMVSSEGTCAAYLKYG
jgi:hydrogenase expression/formation protein HypD